MAQNYWLILIKKTLKDIKAEGKFKGSSALTEAMKRARKIYKRRKL